MDTTLNADDREVLFALGFASPNLARAWQGASKDIRELAAPYLYSGPDESHTPIPLLAHHAEAAFHGKSRDLEGSLIAFLESGAPLTDALRKQLVDALKRRPGETGPRLEVRAAKGKRKSGSPAELIADLRERVRLGEQLEELTSSYAAATGTGRDKALKHVAATMTPALSYETAKAHRTEYRKMCKAVEAHPLNAKLHPNVARRMARERWLRDGAKSSVK